MSEYRLYSTKIWKTRLYSSEGYGVVAIFDLGWIMNQVNSWGQMRLGLCLGMGYVGFGPCSGRPDYV